jgi:hypothetical protein
MDESFIVVSVITTFGGICALLLMDRNWFRRERFKLERDTLKQENNLRMKKMARDLGLDIKKNPPLSSPAQASAPSSPLDSLTSLLPLMKNLAPEQIQDLIGVLAGGSEADESTSEGMGLPGGLDGLLEFAKENPAIVQGFLKGIKGGSGGSDKGF